LSGQRNSQAQSEKYRTQSVKFGAGNLERVIFHSALRVSRFTLFLTVITLLFAAAGCHLGDSSFFPRGKKVTSDPFNVPDANATQSPKKTTTDSASGVSAPADWLQSEDAPSAADWLSGRAKQASLPNSNESSFAQNELSHEPNESPHNQTLPITREPTQKSNEIQQVSYLSESPNLTAERPQNNLAPLLQDRWIFNLELERYRKGETAQTDSFWRWRHRGIEEILILPTEYQPNYQSLLRHENAIVRANAVIILARSGDEQVGQSLVNAIHDASLSSAMRCAAAEAFGSLKTTPPETLIQLSDVYAEYIDEKGRRKPGVPLLSIELLYAIAAKKPLSQEPCFVRPLESRDPKVRLAAISIWRDHAPKFNSTANEQLPQTSATTLPDCIPNLCGDSNAAIQEAAMLTVAAWRSPEALSRLDLGLRNPMVSVRLAAIRGLGMLQTTDAVTLLQPALQDQSPAIRAETVRAFRQAGLREQALTMRDDPAWEVRKAVAESLAEMENPKTAAIARKYLNDVSPAVQIAALESLRRWRGETSAPLFLETMNSNILNTRILAAELLAKYWKPAESFSPNDRTQTREAKYQELVRQFQQDVQSGRLRAENLLPKEDNFRQSANPPQSAAIANFADFPRVRDLLTQFQQPVASRQHEETIRQLNEIGRPLVPMLEYAVFTEGRELPNELLTEVLPAIEPMFAITAKLNSPNTALRRSAITELLAQTRYADVSPLLYSQLTNDVMREKDEIVLLRLWDFVDRQAEKLAKTDAEWQGMSSDIPTQTQQLQQMPSQQSKTFRPLEKALTTNSLACASPELHRRACLHVKDYGQADDIAALLNEICHPATAVSRAALQALTAIGGADCAANVKPLLTHQQPLVVMDAAFALDQWNDPSGLNTLERLAVSGDKTTKLAIAQGIRKRRRQKFVPLLIQLLDETGTIRQEALDALPILVGKDVVPPQELAYYSVQERVELWKKWNAECDVL
jgi:HEAT repeat protein